MTTRMTIYKEFNEQPFVLGRKYRDALITSGGAVIAFSVWNVIRTLLYVSAYMKELLGLVSTELPKPQKIIIGIILYVIISILLAAYLLIHIYVGRTARGVGFGKTKEKKKRAYLVLAGILLGFMFLSVAMSVVSFITDPTGIPGQIASVLLDFTSGFALLELIVSALRLRKVTSEITADGDAVCN